MTKSREHQEKNLNNNRPNGQTTGKQQKGTNKQHINKKTRVPTIKNFYS
jgi:hypothetical protein